jgi:prephenate dehydrogenase
MKIPLSGGGGKMGQWLGSRLAGENKKVIVADRDEQKLKEINQKFGITVTRSNVEAVVRAEIIIVSVPIGSFEAVIREIAPAMRPAQVVMDITSIKARPVAVMHQYLKKALVLGTHPLFGPDVPGLEKQNFVLTPTNEAEKTFALKVKKYLSERGATVKLMPPEEHDKLMAVVQGLSHFIAIISADALSRLGPLEAMESTSTTTFRTFLNYIRTVIGDDPELYAAIQMQHPEMPDIYKVLADTLKQWGETVRQKDMPGFTARMNMLQGYIDNERKR